MSIKTKEEPGLLEGLSKEFFNDVPYNPFITRGEQTLKGTLRGNEIATRSATALVDLKSGQRRQEVATTRGAQEAAGIREATERSVVPLLGDIAASSMAVDGRLMDLQDSLGEVSDQIASGTREMVGIPIEKMDINTLINTGGIDETESVILAMRGVVGRKHAEELFKSLEPWKVEILRSGLVANPNPTRERKLSGAERLYLSDLRRKGQMPTAHFQSLRTVARHGLLDSEAHHALAQRIREVRQGIAGQNYHLEERLQQGDEQLRQGNELIYQGQTAIRQRGTAERQRSTALTLLNTGVFQRNELIGLTGESLGVQKESLSTQRESLFTQRESLVVQAESLTVQRGSARDLSSIRDLAENAEVDRQAIVQHTREIVANTLDLANTSREALAVAQEYGELHADQMDVAQDTRTAQLDVACQTASLIDEGNILLGGIGQRLDGIGELSVLQIERTEQVIDGIEVLSEIAIAQLEVGQNIEIALENIENTISVQAQATRELVRDVALGIQGSFSSLEATLRDLGANEDQRGSDEAFRRGLQWLKRGKVDKAIKAFDVAESRWDLDPRVFFNRAICYVLLDNPNQASEDFETSRLLTPEEPEGRNKAFVTLNQARLAYSEAKVYLTQGLNDEYEEKLLKAVEKAKQAVDETPKFLEAQFALSVYLSAYKLFDKSFEVLIKVLAQDPQYIAKIEHFSDLYPLANNLLNSLQSQDLSDSDKCVAIINDAIEYGDQELIGKVIKILLGKSAFSLNQGKIWTVEGFDLISEQVAELIIEKIEAGEDEDTGCENWYSLASIALNLPGLSKRHIYMAFLNGGRCDPDFEIENVGRVKEKLSSIFSGKWQKLRAIIISKDPEDFPWLVCRL